MGNDKLIITARHVRAAGNCIVPGTRAFFKRHNLDFKDFVKNGIDAERLIATQDAMAIQVVELVSGQISGTNNGQK